MCLLNRGHFTLCQKSPVSFFLSVSWSVCRSICWSLCLSVSWSLSCFVSVSLFHRFIVLSLSICLFGFLSVCLIRGCLWWWFVVGGGSCMMVVNEWNRYLCHGHDDSMITKRDRMRRTLFSSGLYTGIGRNCYNLVYIVGFWTRGSAGITISSIW